MKLITKIKSHTTPNTNRRYRYRILESFYKLYKKNTTPKLTKCKFSIDKTMYFHSSIAIYPY